MGVLVLHKLNSIGFKTIILSLLLFVCVSSSKIQIADKLVGTWEATDYWNNTSNFIVTEDKQVTFSVKGQKFGGNDFQINGNPVEIKYTINNSKTPIWLDLIATDKKSGVALLKVKGLIEFTSYNKAKILLNLDNSRITHFDEKYNKMIITLER